ncbi:MAG: response regulator [Gemmatimonadaceae bacterium]|nr:response regulator [Gemmatimonadaceae bacterium]
MRTRIAALSPGRKIRQIMIVSTDVTARRNAEAARVYLEAQLQQAQKMESVGRLAGGVAHDYNNMQAVILGYAELALLRADAPPPLRQDLTEIHKAATRSAQITQQLLTFARKQVIQPQVLDINATAAHSLTMLRRLIGAQVQFIWTPAGDLWPVIMDAGQVDQILTNLCLNARDAIGGAGTLVIATANRVVDATQCAVLRETAPEAVPGDFVQLTVTDSGGGMSRDMMAQVFEPFYTTKGVGEGTGLGLASVYGAVKQSGGFIAVASVLGEGTTFSVYLPRCTAALAVSRAPDPAAPHLRGQETILVVEDEPAVRRMTVQALELQGYTVLAADHPRDAILLAQEHGDAIALLLTDVQMPEMSGYDLVVALRSSHPYLKHLFMSGYPSGHPVHGRAGEGQPEDADRFIAKPFSLATLTAKVREALDGA